MQTWISEAMNECIILSEHLDDNIRARRMCSGLSDVQGTTKLGVCPQVVSTRSCEQLDCSGALRLRTGCRLAPASTMNAMMRTTTPTTTVLGEECSNGIAKRARICLRCRHSCIASRARYTIDIWPQGRKPLQVQHIVRTAVLQQLMKPYSIRVQHHGLSAWRAEPAHSHMNLVGIDALDRVVHVDMRCRCIHMHLHAWTM